MNNFRRVPVQHTPFEIPAGSTAHICSGRMDPKKEPKAPTAWSIPTSPYVKSAYVFSLRSHSSACPPSKSVGEGSAPGASAPRWLPDCRHRALSSSSLVLLVLQVAHVAASAPPLPSPPRHYSLFEPLVPYVGPSNFLAVVCCTVPLIKRCRTSIRACHDNNGLWKLRVFTNNGLWKLRVFTNNDLWKLRVFTNNGLWKLSLLRTAPINGDRL